MAQMPQLRPLSTRGEGRAEAGGVQIQVTWWQQEDSCHRRGLGWPWSRESGVCWFGALALRARDALMIIADAVADPPVSPGHSPSHTKEGGPLRTPATLCLLFPPLDHVR